MNLDFFNRLANKVEENKDVQKFMNELVNFLKNSVEKASVGLVNMGILEKIENKEKVTLTSRNTIRNETESVLREYANKTQEEGDLYFVTKKRDIEGIYRVEKYDSTGQMEVLDLELPEGTRIDGVMRERSGKYMIDEVATIEVNKRIEGKMEEVLDKQKQELEDYRKEGHIYLVTEKTNNRIYLSDQTESRGFEIEEIGIPMEIKRNIFEGTLLKYENGRYNIYDENDTIL